MPSNLLTLPEGRRTDRPLHFSVKNIVLFGKKAMSHGFSLAWKTSAVTVNAIAAGVPISADAATPADITTDLNVVENFMLSPSCVNGEL